MNKRSKLIFYTSLSLVSIALIAYLLKDSTISVLSPKGIIGLKQKDLITLSTLLMLIVVIPVFLLTFFIAWKYSAKNTKADYRPDWDTSLIAESIWWGVPCAIITILALFTWTSSHELDPYKPIASQKEEMTIQVISLDWKWLFLYPKLGIASVNEVKFPEKTPIRFEVTSDAPMNSFWIPQLGGQIFAMSGMRTLLHLIAEEQGIYRGCSANISGTGFAGMAFNAEALSEEEFTSWANSIKSTSSSLTSLSYQDLARPSQYHPVTYYVLEKKNLFDTILMNYMMPMKEHVSQSPLNQAEKLCLEN